MAPGWPMLGKDRTNVDDNGMIDNPNPADGKEPSTPVNPVANPDLGGIPGRGRNRFTWQKGVSHGPGSKGGANNLRTGNKKDGIAMRNALNLGKLPPRFKHREHQLAMLRNQVEGAVIEAHGGINLQRAALIQTILRNELRAWLAWQWLDESYDKLDALDRLRILDHIAQASQCRDKAIAALDLGRTPKAKVANAFAELQRQRIQNVVAIVEPAAPTEGGVS